MTTQNFLRDLRFGARNLAKSRAFTAIAVGSLALGIGGSTAMYSVIHAVILDPFPYKDAGRLISVTVRGDRGGNAGDPQRLRGNHCTMNTFDIMGVLPLIGRGTAASDSVEGAEPVTVLGYKFWQRQFGGDPGVLGRKLNLNGKIRTVMRRVESVPGVQAASLNAGMAPLYGWM